ncbi:MAG: hypothetical protein ACLVHV_13800 [Oscillospiraceae bacterium]
MSLVHAGKITVAVRHCDARQRRKEFGEAAEGLPGKAKGSFASQLTCNLLCQMNRRWTAHSKNDYEGG